MRLKGRIADLEAKAAQLSGGGGAPLLRVETWDDEIYTDMDSGQTYTRAELDELLADRERGRVSGTGIRAMIVRLNAYGDVDLVSDD